MAERPVRRRCCGNLLAHIGPPDEGHKSTEEISTARGNSFDRLSADCATLVVGHQRLEGCFPYYLPFGRSSDKTMSAARSAPCRNIKLSQYRDIPIDGWVEWARGAHSTVGRTMNTVTFYSRLGVIGLSVCRLAAMTGVQHETARHWKQPDAEMYGRRKAWSWLAIIAGKQRSGCQPQSRKIRPRWFSNCGANFAMRWSPVVFAGR